MSGIKVSGQIKRDSGYCCVRCTNTISRWYETALQVTVLSARALHKSRNGTPLSVSGSLSKTGLLLLSVFLMMVVFGSPAAADPPVIFSVTLNTTAPHAGDPILVTVYADDVTSVVADSTPLIYDNDDIWNGTITAIVGTHVVNISATKDGQDLTFNATQSYTAISDHYLNWTDMGIVYTAPAGSAYYPSVIYSADGFGTGAAYSMWYSDGEGSVFRTMSTDGATWGLPVTMTGIPDAHHVQVIYSSDGFNDAPTAKYRIWYWNQSAHLYSISSMATAYSTDGVNWTGVAPLTQNPAAPLVTGSNNNYDWHRGSYGPVSVFYNRSAPNAGVNPWAYAYTMYFDGTNGGWEQTGLAYSSDGIYWTAVSQDPVLGKSPVPAWDSEDTVYGTVYADAAGYHYWYSGGPSTPYNGIGYAFSANGIDWTKDKDPIFTVADGFTYRDKRTYTPSVIDKGYGNLMMYYSAAGSSGGSVKKIGLAVLPPSDKIPPTVSSTNPANSAAGVVINIKPAATFSEEMDPLTITTSTFTLTGPNATPVGGSVTCTGFTATFAPAANLTPETVYTATITTGAGDLAGNKLAGAYVWNFTTGNAIAPAPPVAGLTADKTEGLAPFSTRFWDNSTGIRTAWLWDFGDGNTSTVQNPSYTYNATGTYTVSLTASNSGGSNMTTRSGYITVSAPVITTSTFSLPSISTSIVGNTQNVTITSANATISGNVVNVTGTGTTWNHIEITLTDAPVFDGTNLTGNVSSVQAVTNEVTVPIPSLGNPNVSLSLELAQIPGSGASITSTISSDPTATEQSSFTLAATNSGNQITAVAYTVAFGKTGIDNAADGGIIRNATITMTVSPDWVVAYGGTGRIVIMHRSDDGTTTLLQTQFSGTDISGNYIFTAISPTGLSTFVLAAISPVPASATNGGTSIQQDSGSDSCYGGGISSGTSARQQQADEAAPAKVPDAPEAPESRQQPQLAPLERETPATGPQAGEGLAGNLSEHTALPPGLNKLPLAALIVSGIVIIGISIVIYLKMRKRRLDPLR
ncbi:MAG: PKD domain protein [Methanoregula sp. PtaU1.Bin051]|nr:MAG: PKD domain protein [Methanoregula sp. PtaU1.Bin051]